MLKQNSPVAVHCKIIDRVAATATAIANRFVKCEPTFAFQSSVVVNASS